MITQDMYPGRAHPAVERHAAVVRTLMTSGLLHILMPRPGQAAWSPDPELSVLFAPDLVFTVHRVWAEAPYTGCPFVYVWKVALDNLGRAVGDIYTELHHLCLCCRDDRIQVNTQNGADQR
jgi:hypothetical protein